MTDKNILINRVAYELYRLNNTGKFNQLAKVKEISEHLTSADGISITEEMFSDYKVRYTITGTRSSMTLTVTYDSDGNVQMTRKTKNTAVIGKVSESNIYVSEIIDRVHEYEALGIAR